MTKLPVIYAYHDGHGNLINTDGQMVHAFTTRALSLITNEVEYRAVVLCKDCQHHTCNPDALSQYEAEPGECVCSLWDATSNLDGFCHLADRENGTGT